MSCGQCVCIVSEGLVDHHSELCIGERVCVHVWVRACVCVCLVSVVVGVGVTM